MALLLRWLPLALLTAFALWLRTHELARRPMHADEANQGVKTGLLLETGHYRFDPADHHGPTLYYAALPLAWLRGQRTLAALDETTIRLVPALFGTAAVILVFLLALPLGHWTAFAVAAFLAVSPPAVYYSRFFIQETLLLTLTLATLLAARRWWWRRTIASAIALGVSVGLMQATKSTAPLFLLCAGISFWVGRASARPSAAHQGGLKSALPQAALALAVAILTAAMLYSSFFMHPGGVVDAFTTYADGWVRVSGESGHEKPWWYFLQLFTWQKPGGIVWQQLAFAALAFAGLAITCVPRLSTSFLRWTAIYTALLFGTLALTPYKTPWHAIHLIPGLAILGAGALAAVLRLPTGKFIAIPAAVLIAGTLFQQTARAAFHRAADARNPFAYVHSAPDVLKVRALAETARARAPERPIRVIGEEYWPLPWYLRGIGQVGYWSTAPDDCDGALIIATAAQAEAVRARLGDTYTESILGLRPGVLLVVFSEPQ